MASCSRIIRSSSGKAAVLKLRRLGVVTRALRALNGKSDLLQLFSELADRLDRLLFLLPVRLEARLFFLQVGQLFFEPTQAFSRRGIPLLAERLALDLELHDAPTHLVELRRHGVDLHP